MASNSAGASGSGLFGTLASWGSSVYSYAQEQITTCVAAVPIVPPSPKLAAKHKSDPHAALLFATPCVNAKRSICVCMLQCAWLGGPGRGRP